MSEVNVKLVQKFRQMAGKLDEEIAYKRRVRTENPTRKRLQEEAHQRVEADRLEKEAFALRGLAAAHESGSVPVVLAGVRTKKEIGALLMYDVFHFWLADRLSKTGIDASNYADARRELLALANPPDRAAENALAALERKARSLIGVIPGFFPTPVGVGEEMCDLSSAEADEGLTILEPSAGNGALLAVIAGRFPGNRLIACEINVALRDLLACKGVEMVGDDFLEYEGEVDHVIMNPPFEDGADAEHVMHAYSLLRPGGSLVSVMSNSVQFRTDGKYGRFRVWRDALDWCDIMRLPEGAFRESGTGVNAVLFVTRKPAALEVAGKEQEAFA